MAAQGLDGGDSCQRNLTFSWVAVSLKLRPQRLQLIATTAIYGNARKCAFQQDARLVHAERVIGWS